MPHFLSALIHFLFLANLKDSKIKPRQGQGRSLQYLTQSVSVKISCEYSHSVAGFSAAAKVVRLRRNSHKCASDYCVSVNTHVPGDKVKRLLMSV